MVLVPLVVRDSRPDGHKVPVEGKMEYEYIFK